MSDLISPEDELSELLAEIVVSMLERGVRSSVVFERVNRVVSGSLWAELESRTVSNKVEQYAEMGIDIVTYWDKNYPTPLRFIDGAPVCLFVKGELVDFTQRLVAVVGSRKMSLRGRRAVALLVSGLVRSGVGVISGLALGVDGFSHKVCLGCGGLAVGVMPCSLDSVYPSSHTQLAKELLESGGCLVSEYPLGMKMSKGCFLERNRVMAGLSGGVLVVEAERYSGSVSTANWAMEQGKNVWCASARVGEENSAGVLELVTDGAKMVSSVEEILCDL